MHTKKVQKQLINTLKTDFGFHCFKKIISIESAKGDGETLSYAGEEALGLVETVGMVPAIQAADKMLKAANVELVSYENVGSTLVTIMVKGDVAAVRASVEAGAAAASAIGKLTAKNVMPRPIKSVGEIVSIYDVNK